MSKGINIGDAAISIIHQRQGSGTIEDLTAAIEHLDGTKPELKEALAYAAAQVWAYRSKTNEDASLALSQIRTTLREFERRHASLNDLPKETPHA